MSEEPIAGKMQYEAGANAAIGEFKDWVILLDMAGEYVCERHVLNRIASSIEKNSVVLRNWSEELKERFVGKPLHEIDVEEPLEKLIRFSKKLEEADDYVPSQCREGKVARELEDKVRLVRERLDALEDRVEGEAAPYTVGDSVGNILGRLKVMLHALVSTSRLATKIIFVVLLGCLVTFVALSATMETEKDVLQDIYQSRSVIRTKEAELSRVRSWLAQTKALARAMGPNVRTREDKISLLELDLRAHRLSDQKERIQEDLNLQEKILNANAKKLEEMKRKSFVTRLLRM